MNDNASVHDTSYHIRNNYETLYSFAYELYCDYEEFREKLEEFAKHRFFSFCFCIIEVFGLASRSKALEKKRSHADAALKHLLNYSPTYANEHKRLHGNVPGYKPVAQHTRRDYISEFENRRKLR